MTDLQLRNLFCELPDPEAPPPQEEDPPFKYNFLPAYTPNTIVWITMDDEALKERFKTEACLEMDEEEVDVKLEAYAAQLEEYRTLEEAANVDESAADAAPAKGKDKKGKGGDAPAETEKLGKELFTNKLANDKFVCMAPAEWPDTSLPVREAIGEPKNISGPGSLLSDEWVAPVEEVEPEPEPLPVPPAIATIRAAKADAVAKQAYNQEVDMNRALFEMAQPLRLQLLETVMPTLTEGLIKVCEDQPQDPIEYLQRFLLEREELQNQNRNKAHNKAAATASDL